MILKVSLVIVFLLCAFTAGYSQTQTPQESDKVKYEKLLKQLDIEKQRLLEERREIEAIKNSPLGIREREMIFYGVFILLITVIIFLFITRERRIKRGSREEIQKLQLIMKDLINEVGKYLDKTPEAANIGDLVLKAGNGVKNINTRIERPSMAADSQQIDYDAIYALFAAGTDKIAISKRFNISPGEVDFIIKLKALKARDAR